MLRPPEHAEQIAREMARVWEGEAVERHDTLRLTKDGRRIPVSLGIFPLRDINGRIVGTSSITRDLTALRETQEALHLRNRALDAASNGVLITNPLLPDNPIIDVNPAFTRLTGYARDEVLGRNCRFLQGPDTDAAAVQRLRAAIAAGSDTSETLLNYRKDGTPFWNDLSIAAVRDAAGQLTHFIGVQTDATARKQLELELVAALEAAQAGIRTKTLFLAMMSHELRTPLQAVLGYADFLLNAPPGSLTPEQRDDVGFIRQGAGRMVTLIEQLLDLSRMEAGRLDLAAGPVDLETILEQVRQDIAPVVTAKGLELTIDLPASLPPVLGDAVRLRQVLLNLIGNAVKFTDVGSVRVSAALAAGGVAVAVRDTGIGISEEALPFIFEEFRQVDGSFTRRYGGAGLGLAIARKLAEQMGGSIDVESSLGAGSAFTVWLPADLPIRTHPH
jgi:PAS domain S-box-containing protein